MACSFLPGISSCIFPDPVITRQEYALLAEYGIASVEIGYEQAGPALASAPRYEQLIAVSKDARPPVWSLHAPYRPERDLSVLDDSRRSVAVAHTVEAIRLAQRLGAQLMVLHGSQDPILPGERAARRGQACKSLADLVPHAREMQIRLALELMPPEWLPAGSAEALQMVDDLDPQVVGFCLDANHANLTGELPDIVHALGARIWNIHLSDNDGVKQRHWMPMQGIIDWQAFLTALTEIGYHGPLHYELDPHAAGPRQGLQEIAHNFQRLVALVA